MIRSRPVQRQIGQDGERRNDRNVPKVERLHNSDRCKLFKAVDRGNIVQSLATPYL